jgi:glycosyltransferase involved in cell wall biosynthesis
MSGSGPENVRPVAVAVTSWEPGELRVLFPGATEIVVFTVGQRDRQEAEVAYVGVPGFGPRFYRALREHLRGQPEVALLDGDERLPMRWLRGLYGAGVRRILVRRGGGWRRVALSRALIRRHFVAGLTWIAARLAPPPSGRRPPRRWPWRIFGPVLERVLRFRVAVDEWRAHAERVAAVSPASARERLEVALYVSSLNSGGAERQHVNLAVGLTHCGHRVRVLSTRPLEGEEAHYVPLLHREGIPVSQAGGPSSYRGQHRLDADWLMAGLTHEIRSAVMDLAGELAARPVDVLHATLDYPNVVAAAAGILAGVPHIILSTRNSNPSHFSFYRPWMDHWYRFACTRPNVHLIANSSAGAEDYARWIGVPASRFTVILNGVDLGSLPAPPANDVAAVRAELGAPPGDPLVTGIFRLSWEKQPQLFLDVVARVAAAVPRLKVALVGIGAEQDAVRRGIQSRGLGGTVRMLGQRRDVAAVLSASDVFLLTSAFEGTPNVALEAQWFGCPPVVTRAGGSPETIEPGVTGFVHDVDDAAGLAASIVQLLTDADLRAAMADAGQRRIREHFSMERVLEQTLALYRRVTGLTSARI